MLKFRSNPPAIPSTITSRYDDATLARWLAGAIDRVSRYVYGRSEPVKCGQVDYRSSVRRETSTVGRDGEIVHLDLADGRRRIVFKRQDSSADHIANLPASDDYKDICFYDNLLFVVESGSATTTVLKGYAVDDYTSVLTEDQSASHEITRGFAPIRDVTRVEIVNEYGIEGGELEHLWVAQDNATYATARGYGLDFTAVIEGVNGNGWEFLFYGLPGSGSSALLVEPELKVVNVWVPVGVRREEVVTQLNNALVADGAPFHVALAPGQDGTQQSTATGGITRVEATAGGHGKSRLFRGDRTLIHRGGAHQTLAQIKAEADPKIIINGEVVIVSLVGSGSLVAVARQIQADVRLWGANFASVAHLSNAVCQYINGRFEFGIPGFTTLVLGGTTIEDMGLLPDDSATRTVWEIDDAEDSHLTAGYPIVGMHYSKIDKTLYVVLSNGQVHAIDRRWFGRPDTRIERRDFQLPDVGTVYSASTYEEDGTMTVAEYGADGVRTIHTLVFNPNIPLGEVRSVAKYYHRSVDVTDVDNPGKTRGKQSVSKWDTKSIPEMYGVPSSGAAGTAYADATGWWDLEDPRKFYFGEPAFDITEDVLVIDVDTERGDVDYQIVRATETSPTSGVQIKQTLAGESANSKNHAYTLFRLEPKVYILKTVFVYDTTDLPRADAIRKFDFAQAGTRFTLKRVMSGQDDVVAVALTDSRDKGATAPPVNVITDVQDEFEVFDSHDLYWIAVELNGADDDYGQYVVLRHAAKFQAVVELFEVVD